MRIQTFQSQQTNAWSRMCLVLISGNQIYLLSMRCVFQQ